MYLLTFTILVMAILGLFTQVVTIQTAQMFAKQTAIARIMYDWHTGAVNLARAQTTYNDCNVSINGSLFGVNKCSTLVTAGNLSLGYQDFFYTWYSFIYTPADATSRYVVTFVEPSGTNLVTNPSIGITSTALLGQLKRLKLSKISYGIVRDQGAQGRRLQVDVGLTGLGVLPSYRVPNQVPDGAVAIVTPL